MFKPKQKQPTKPKSSKSLAFTSIDSYFQKTKSSHFDIYLNSGVDEYDLDNSYTTRVSVDRCEQFLDSLVKGFSSIYQMDHRAFEWKDRIDGLIKTGKDILKVIDKMKQQAMGLDQKKLKVDTLQSEVKEITQKYNQLQAKYNQLLNESLQNKATSKLYLKDNQRLQNLLNRQILFNQRQTEIKQIKAQNLVLSQQNYQLKTQIHDLTNLNTSLKSYLTKIINSSFSQRTMAQITYQFNHKQQQANPHIKKTEQTQLKQPEPKTIFQTQILLNPFISSIIISYLPPKSLTSLFSLTKTTRFFLLHTPMAIHSSFRSIINYKQYEIAFFHRHINHFQQQIKKIPEEIIQSTFYQFNILKENVGGDFMTILNLCANVFQGKFNAQSAFLVNKTVKQYVESKEILHYVESPKEQEFFLRIDKTLVKHFFQQRKAKKQQVMKEIEQMTQKISTAQNLYSVDSQTLSQFHQTILRHFTILFVLAKHLFAQSRSLQHLNKYILSELNQITKFKIQKEYDMQDIKAQVQASNKMCLFLSDKCNKSEQRILRQTKQHLQTQRHMGKLADIIKRQQQKVKRLQGQLLKKDVQISKIKQKYNELKAIYTSSKDKHNRLVNQLAILKQTILNIK